jgi:hypothetical protein
MNISKDTVYRLKNPYIIRGKKLKDPSDYINTVRFLAYVPFHTLKLPDLVESGEVFVPWIEDIVPNSMYKIPVTISFLLGLHKKRVQYKIVNKFDLIIIKEYINNYLNSIKNLEHNISKDILELLKDFLDTIENMIKRSMDTDPSFKMYVEDFQPVFTKIRNRMKK